tara:strand:- start:782 stop:910 length:129 start_codon:yes stop_codon:yes gene_type:complete
LFGSFLAIGFLGKMLSYYSSQVVFLKSFEDVFFFSGNDVFSY